MKRILVVDGDTGVRARIAKHARMEGYDVTEAGDGETALSLSRQQNAFDLMVLAVNLPGMDGFTVLKAVRTFSAIPVLILSSKNTAEDRIHGLELGADDYMTKPFSARELLLRISAILKRCSTLASEEAEVLRSGGLVLDLTARRVEVDGRQINLTPREFDLLTVLMSHPDVAFSRKRLLDIIWGGELSTDTRTLDTPISSISAVPSSRTATGSSPSAGWATGSRRNKKEAGPSKGPASSSRDPSIHRAPPQKPSPCGGKVRRREP